MSKPSTTIEEMLDDCNSAKDCSNVEFTAWEEKFLESITEQFDERGSLTEKQEDRLRSIWEKI